MVIEVVCLLLMNEQSETVRVLRSEEREMKGGALYISLSL